MEPDNVRALETSGALLIDLGNLDAAKQVRPKKICVLTIAGTSLFLVAKPKGFFSII